MKTRKVTVCGVPHEMSIVDGGVLFSNKSGFYGVSRRIMFARRNRLWYIENAAATFDSVPLCHLVKMAKLLDIHIDANHTSSDPQFTDLPEV